MSTETSNNPTTEVAIIKKENIAAIVHSAPESYKRNAISVQNCVTNCTKLLNQIRANGMTDELDRTAAKYIERTRVTLKEMNERRSPYTKLFDQIRSEFTKLENAIDPAKAGTVAYQLQQMRNEYAALKRQEEERRRQAELAELEHQRAKAAFRASVEECCWQSFNAFLHGEINKLSDLCKSLTLENYQAVADTITSFPDSLPADWMPAVGTISRPYNITHEEATAIQHEVLSVLRPKFVEGYDFDFNSSRTEILDSLPSKKKELERMAEASAAEAERIKAEIAAREAAEAAAREKQRRMAEEEARRKAELDKANAEVAGLFGASKARTAYAPKAKVTKKLCITDPQAFLAIVSTWWQHEGCNMSVDDLTKTFKKQITCCEKLANKENFMIEGVPGLEYVDDVKAQ